MRLIAPSQVSVGQQRAALIPSLNQTGHACYDSPNDRVFIGS